DDLNALRQVYEKSVGEGQRVVTSRRKDCSAVEHDLAELESAIPTPLTGGTSPPPTALAPPPVRNVGSNSPPPNAIAVLPPADSGRTRAAGTQFFPPPASPPPPMAQANLNPLLRGVTADEIRFGIVAPFSGSTKELGLQMKTGIEVAFNEANA